MKDFVILIDKQEKTPWIFPKWVKTKVVHLKTADYCVEHDYLCLERKSKSDFLGTISTGWNRFIREIERMTGWPCKIVIVECDILSFYYQEIDEKIISPDHEHYKLSPQFITKRIAQLSLMGVSIIFCHNSEISSAVAYKILEERHNAIKHNS